MGAWVTIGHYLLRRLNEAGIQHAFGVPGDFNLNLMQQIEDGDEIDWIGNCNELNAAYAADGYARLNGLSALFVTYGVGALSAINGVAGAYSEHVPVICISGSLPAVAGDRDLRMHHTLGEGGRGEFLRAYTGVTAAQSVITPQNAVMEIDRLIREAWQRKRPVYMEMPSDITYLEVFAPTEPILLERPRSDRERLAVATRAIADRLDAATSPVILVDLDADRHGVADEITELSSQRRLPVVAVNTAKAVIDETHPYYLGIYSGAGSARIVRHTVETSDCLVAIGYRRVDSTSGFFSDSLPTNTIHVRDYSADVDGENFQAVTLKELLGAVTATAGDGKHRAAVSKPPRPTTRDADMPSGPLTQSTYWRVIQDFVRPGDVIIAEDGTSAIGAGALDLPSGCTFITQAVWGSIGYTVGALLGALLAAPQRRHLLFVGDGSFQLTGQEVSTILRHDLKPIIFLVNNSGYTIERTILGKESFYNDIAPWAYAELPRVLRPDTNAMCRQVGTVEDFQHVLNYAGGHDGMVFIEAVMDSHDAPEALIDGGHQSASLDYGPRGPQHRTGSEI